LSISFDDARGSQVDHHSSALFKQHGIRVTYFVSLANLEKKLDLWRAVVADGHEIGNHSIQHPCSGNFPWIGDGEKALENYSLPKMEAELLEANRRIRQMLGVTPVSYAYPCGLDFVGRGERRASYVPAVARHFLVGRGYRGEYANNPIFCDLSMVQTFGADHDGLAAIKAYADQAINSGYWVILIADRSSPGANHVVFTTPELVLYVAQPALNPVVEAEEIVFLYTPADNGSAPSTTLDLYGARFQPPPGDPATCYARVKLW